MSDGEAPRPLALHVLVRSLGVCWRHALALVALALVAGAPPILLFLGVAVSVRALRMDVEDGSTSGACSGSPPGCRSR